MESQSGHHPGHHGHSAPHNSTLPHHVHVGGNASHHQINLDNHAHHHQHSSQHHQSHSKQKHTEPVEVHKTHHSSHHHHHHHVSRKAETISEAWYLMNAKGASLIIKNHFHLCPGEKQKFPNGKCKVFHAIAQCWKRDHWKCYFYQDLCWLGEGKDLLFCIIFKFQYCKYCAIIHCRSWLSHKSRRCWSSAKWQLTEVISWLEFDNLQLITKTHNIFKLFFNLLSKKVSSANDPARVRLDLPSSF